ncbi:MAG: type II toxin-antitoxin system VapC family toxin [Jatrophihabitans sp.]
MNVAYLDTSALVKLVVREAESEALQAWIQDRGPDVIATSMLAGVELRRASSRHSRAAAEVAERILSSVDQIAMTPDLLREAAAVEPAALRSLDAIHLATACRIGSSLSAFVAYDLRLLAAAEAAGLATAQPQ